MSRRKDDDLLSDIYEALRRIEEYQKNSNYEEFLRDTKTQDAIVRNLEIIGEASKNISDDIIKQFPEVRWNNFAKVRDKLIHHYFGINLDIVWNILKDALPNLAEQVKVIIEKNKEGD